MKEKIFISLSGRNQTWFDKKSPKEKKEYLASHPKSKFGKGTAAKPAAKKAAAKKVVAKPVKKASTPASKRPITKTAKKAAPKTPAKKSRAKKPSLVHKDTDKLHSEAVKQKKTAIDKIIAPYARELGKLRLKRDSGAGLSNSESTRYKQILTTIQELHRGR